MGNTKWFLLYFQNNFVWLILSGIVNHPSKALRVTNLGSNLRWISERTKEGNDMHFSSNMTHIEEILPDPWKKNSHLKLMQAVTLITNSSNCWICSQFPTHSDESIQLMGLPIPNKFSNSFPPADVMHLFKEKVTHNTIDKQILTVKLTAINASCVQRCPEKSGATPRKQTKSPNCMLGIMVGNYPKCNSYLDVTNKSILNTQWWPIPDNIGYYWLCGNSARKTLPPKWQGICTIGTVVPEIDIISKSEFPKGHLRSFIMRHKRTLNPLIEKSSGFDKFMRGLVPWLGVPELEKAIINISGVIEQIENRTSDAIGALQQEVTSLSNVVKENRMALDLILASKGGVCTVINTSCCVYIDQTQRIQTDLEEIRKNSDIFQEIQKNQGVDIFDWITSWIPNLNAIIRKLIGIAIIVLTLIIGVWILIQICKLGCKTLCKLNENKLI